MGQRQIKICYINHQPQLQDSSQALFQSRLKHLFEIDWVFGDSLAKAPIEDSDLLILQARHVEDDGFKAWLQKQSVHLAGRVYPVISTLILKDLSFAALADIYLHTAENNWYVDIMSSAEIESLPIRIANLLRIYDHMRELDRYANTIKFLQEKLSQLEIDMLKLSKPKK